MVYTLGQLAEHVNGTVEGDATKKIIGISTLRQANENQISFFDSLRYKPELAETRAGAVIMSSETSDIYSGDKLIYPNPRLALAYISKLYAPQSNAHSGIHGTSIIGSRVSLGENVAVSARVVVEDDVNIGDNVYIGPGSVIGRGVTIGAHTVINANVVIHSRCNVGESCILSSGVVIGADGFGFAKENDSWIRIEQLGSVQIGDSVEIGANSTIDRGSAEDTVIENGVKIDNLVQIGHNVHLGENTIIAAGAGIAGSARIGKRCAIGGMSGIHDHVEIVDDVSIAGFSMVSKSIKVPGIYSSSLRAERLEKWQKNAARVNQLNDLANSIKDMARRIEQIEEGK